MSPLISVLIPTYNVGKYLGAALDSVYAQTFGDYEIIVVDDGSTDGTETVIARYPQVIYRKCPHRGISATRNECLSLAKGEWLAFLDADDLWHPEKLSRQLAYLQAHPDCRILFTQAENFYDGDLTAMTSRQQQLANRKLSLILPSCLFHRSLYEIHGGFVEDYPWAEDTEWILRLRAAAVNLDHCLPEVLYFRRVHESNISLTHTAENLWVGRTVFLNAMRSRVKLARKQKIETEDTNHE